MTVDCSPPAAEGALPKINVIGCGRAAGSLVRMWRAENILAPGEILNRSQDSARRAVEKLGAGTAVARLSEMGPADIWLIGTGDDRIAGMASELARHVSGEASMQGALNGALVFHLAGRLGPDVLQPAAGQGARIGALHPVRSLTHAKLTVEQFRGTACVAEGDEAALQRLKPLVDAVGGLWIPVRAVDRGLYHAALSIVSNVTKGVAWKAQNWLERAGLETNTAAAVTHQLLQSTMDDLFRHGARQSITGPVVRGDTRTVEAHLDALRTSYPQDVELYCVLAKAVLDLAQERGDLDASIVERFRTLLGGGADSA